MNYLSVCAGIEAATVAWHHLGWKATAYSEIEPFPSAVLAHHYPQTPNLGDMTRYRDWSIDEPVNLLVGGTPCQSFSVAGLRKGLDDPRGNLALVYLGIADHFQPRWIAWENVPGVLSSNKGRDFGAFLGALGQLGYGWAYRVLDAQFFGVAQRRRRVFVVGCLGDWASAAAVLFERESLRRDTAPSRKTGEEIAGTLMARASSGGWSNSVDHAAAGYMQPVAPAVSTGAPFSRTENERVEADAMVVQTFDKQAHGKYGTNNVAATINARDYKDATDLVTQPIALAENTIGRQPQNGGNGNGFTIGGPMYTLNATGVHGLAQPITFEANMSYETPSTKNVCHALKRRTTASVCKLPSIAVRRLTPIECERLQGFPDNYTRIAWRKKQPEDCPDGPRYKALGNSMAVPVMRWIGERIAAVEALT